MSKARKVHIIRNRRDHAELDASIASDDWGGVMFGGDFESEDERVEFERELLEALEPQIRPRLFDG